MKHSDFKIGSEFIASDGKRWRVTDIGTRVIVAICIHPVVVTVREGGELRRESLATETAERQGWFDGATAEIVWDEDDMEAITAICRI